MEVIYSNGVKKEFHTTKSVSEPEFELVKASYADDKNKVSDILKKNKNIDVNAIVWHSPNKGNGSPLILTSKKCIAELLIQHGADVNLIMDRGSVKITALDSAYKELNSSRGKKYHEQVSEFVRYLEEQGGQRYEDLVLFA